MAKAVRERKVTGGEYVFYVCWLVLGIILTALTPLALSSDPTIYVPGELKYIELWFTLLFIPISLLISYIANQAGDKKDFWYRYMCISFPTDILFLGIAFGINILGLALGFMHLDTFTYIDAVVFEGLGAISLYVMYRFMRKAAGA